MATGDRSRVAQIPNWLFWQIITVPQIPSVVLISDNLW